MENFKNLNNELNYYGLNNLLDFCESQNCDEDKVLCYLERYRSSLKNKMKIPIEGLQYMVEDFFIQ